MAAAVLLLWTREMQCSIMNITTVIIMDIIQCNSSSIMNIITR